MATQADLLSRLVENARILEEEEKAKKEIGAQSPMGTIKEELSLIPEKKMEVPRGPLDIEPGSLPYTPAAISTARSLQRELPQETYQSLKPIEQSIAQTTQLNEKRAEQVKELGQKLESEAETKQPGEINIDDLIAKVGIKKRGEENPGWLTALMDVAVAAVPILVGQAVAGGKYGGSVAMYAGGKGATEGLEFLEKRRKEERDARKEMESLVLKSELESALSERKLPGRMQELRFKSYQDQIAFLNEAMLKGEISKAQGMEEASKIIQDAEKRFTANYVDLLKAGLSAAKPKEYKPETEAEKAKSEDIVFGDGKYILPVKAQAQIQQKKRIDEFREQASALKDMQDAITVAYNLAKDGRPLSQSKKVIYDQALNKAVLSAKNYYVLGSNFTESEQQRVTSILGSDPNRAITEIIKQKWSGDPSINAKSLARAYKGLETDYERKIKNFGAVVVGQKPAQQQAQPKKQGPGLTRQQMIDALKKGK